MISELYIISKLGEGGRVGGGGEWSYILTNDYSKGMEVYENCFLDPQ